MKLSPKERAIEGCHRKNRATRKLLRIDGLDSNVRLTALTIIDFLNYQSFYEVAWPSVNRLAKRLGISDRSVKRYLAQLRKLSIFEIHRLSPESASQFLRRRYGLDQQFTRCRKHAPNIYEINSSHPLWDEFPKLRPEISLSMVSRLIEPKVLSKVGEKLKRCDLQEDSTRENEDCLGDDRSVTTSNDTACLLDSVMSGP